MLWHMRRNDDPSHVWLRSLVQRAIAADTPPA
jgi:hypothetical protein